MFSVDACIVYYATQNVFYAITIMYLSGAMHFSYNVEILCKSFYFIAKILPIYLKYQSLYNDYCLMIILHIYLISTTFAFNFIDNLNLILRGYRESLMLVM